MKILNKTVSREQFAWFLLFAILVFTAIVRYRLLSVPFERDEGEYAYAGQLILQGIPPYKEVFNMKFPGIYAAYALGMGIFGQTHQGIHLALLVINAITIIAVFLIAKYITNPICAVASAACFALLSVSQPVQGVFANAEHFVIVFVTSGLFVLLHALENKRLYLFFIVGLFLGLGFLMKQHGFLFTILAFIYIIYDSLIKTPILWRDLALRLLLFISGVLVIFGALFLAMVWAGVFKTFWFWTFKYALTYISQVPLGQAWQGFTTTFLYVVRSAPLLWIMAGLGCLVFFSNNLAKRNKVFLALYSVCSFLSICPGFYFRPHYFVLLLPCISLLAGISIMLIKNMIEAFPSKQIQYGLPMGLFSICLCHTMVIQRDYLFRLSPVAVSRSTYGLNPFPESLEIAKYIRNHSDPEDRIAVVGSEPQIFFYSKRRSASSYIYMYPLMETHDFALQMQKDFMKDVTEVNPKYVVFVNITTSWLRNDKSHTEIFQWLDKYFNSGFMKLVGVIELLDEGVDYSWDSKVKWPVSSPFWIIVFRNDSV